MIKLNISHPALDYLKFKGVQLIIFRGSLTGCCVGSVPAPMLEVGRPRRPVENYNLVLENGLEIYIDKELADYNGVADITLDKNLWWKSISFNYKDDN